MTATPKAQDRKGAPSRPAGPHKPHRIIGRHLVGRPWHGQPCPEASFWQRSPHEPPAWFSRTGRPSPWRRLHPWQRALVWWGVYVGIPAAGLLWLTSRFLAVIVLPIAITILAVGIPRLTIRRRHRARPLPAIIGPRDVERHLTHATGTKLLTGMAKGGPKGLKPVFVKLKTDSPHVGLSSATGGGKSETATGLTVQFLHHGGIALILDYKMTSFPWARDLPNVRYCKTTEDIHNGLMWLDGELAHRREAADRTMNHDGTFDQDAVGPPLMLLADEMNATSELLGDHWTRVLGQKGPSPAARTLRLSLFTGRAHRTHVIAIAQQLNAAAAGGGGRNGGAARENLGVRILIWFTEQTAKMLVPDLMPLPEIPHLPGRMMVCVGKKYTETQAVLWSAAEAREYATSGAVVPFPEADPSTLTPDPEPLVEAGQETGGQGSGVTPLRLVADRHTLREHADRGTVPVGYEALKSARRRGGFPEGMDGTYTVAEIKEWFSARTRSTSASRPEENQAL